MRLFHPYRTLRSMSRKSKAIVGSVFTLVILVPVVGWALGLFSNPIGGSFKEGTVAWTTTVVSQPSGTGSADILASVSVGSDQKTVVMMPGAGALSGDTASFTLGLKNATGAANLEVTGIEAPGLLNGFTVSVSPASCGAIVKDTAVTDVTVTIAADGGLKLDGSSYNATTNGMKLDLDPQSQVTTAPTCPAVVGAS